MKTRQGFWKRNAPNIVLVILIVLFFVAVFAHRIFIFIDAGEAGVKFRRFFGGVVTTEVYGEGMRVIPPWDRMTVYDVRVQEIATEFSVLTSNGLALTVQVSARFHPYYNALPLLHQRIGPNYKNKVVIPVVESSVRKAIGEHRAEELYSNKGPVLYQINQDTAAALGENFIALDGVVIRTIRLPKFIEQAIELKEEQRELLEAYGYRLRREKDEALRKEIEAFGWQNFNTIVGQSLSPRLLQWRGIEATRELATSRNAKIIIMGNGDKGLPVILNADAGAGAAPDLSKPKTPADVLPIDNLEQRISNDTKLFDALLKKNSPAPGPAAPVLPPPVNASPTPAPATSPTGAPTNP